MKNKNSSESAVFNDWKLMLILCLTLGLAPFTPPHIIGKIQWVLGGAVGMKLIDWFDLFFHGIPWILLIRALIINFTVKKEDNSIEN